MSTSTIRIVTTCLDGFLEPTFCVAGSYAEACGIEKLACHLDRSCITRLYPHGDVDAALADAKQRFEAQRMAHQERWVGVRAAGGGIDYDADIAA